VTDEGDEVLLYDDGTWKYKKEPTSKISDIETNPAKFSKSENQTLQVKSTKIKVGIWINPQKWTFNKAKNNKSAEYEFKSKDKELYGMIISESIEIPILSLKEAAISNA